MISLSFSETIGISVRDLASSNGPIRQLIFCEGTNLGNYVDLFSTQVLAFQALITLSFPKTVYIPSLRPSIFHGDSFKNIPSE